MLCMCHATYPSEALNLFSLNASPLQKKRNSQRSACVCPTRSAGKEFRTRWDEKISLSELHSFWRRTPVPLRSAPAGVPSLKKKGKCNEPQEAVSGLFWSG